METLTLDEAALAARLAATLNGGRFAHLVSDETVKAEAAALVKPMREKRRRLAAQAREAKRRGVKAAEAALMAEWLRSWRDYSPEDAARIDDVFRIYSEAPKRSVVRAIARAILGGKHNAECVTVTSPEEACDCIPADWRSVIRAYRDARNALAEAGSFMLSRADMTPDSGSRFYRNVVQHWHNYAGGKHVAIHGVTPDDIFQDAMVRAIEAGDTVTGYETRRMVWADDDGSSFVESRSYEVPVPAFGNMYMHTRQATEAAVYTYRRGHNNPLPFTLWTWADWQAWASENNGPRLAYSSNVNVMAEWLAYDAASKAEHKRMAYEAGLKSYREERMPSLADARRDMAAWILAGGTVQRLANVLGRTVEALANEMSKSDATTPVASFI